MGYIETIRKKVGHDTVIMPCACVIIGDGKGNVLLQQRTDDYNWGYHGGAIEIDESAEEAVLREVNEELGVTLKNLKLLGVYSGKQMHHTYPNGDDTSPIDIVYYTNGYIGEIKLDVEEVLKVEWFNEETLPINLCKSNVKPFKDYFKMLKG